MEDPSRLFATGSRIAGSQQCQPKRTLLIAGQGDQSRGKFRQLVPADRACPLGRPQMGLGEASTQVLVPRPVLNQHREDAAILHREFRPDDAADPGLSAGPVESGHALDPHAVGHRHHRDPKTVRLRHQHIRQ